MKTAVLIVSLLLFTTIAKAQIAWQHCYGGTDGEQCNVIRTTIDGGYILAGYAFSNNDDVSGNHGGGDFWVVKITAAGTIEWQKCYGGSSGEEAYDIRQTFDSGFVVAGYSSSNDGDVTGNHGGGDVWVIKLTATGVMQWQKCLGGSGRELASSIWQTNDGGYVVAGQTNSNDGDVSENHGGYYDVWVVKLSDTGTIVWAKCYGGSSGDYGNSIQQTFDGGYIVGGGSFSDNGDVSGHHGDTTTADFWVLKLAVNDSIEWQKSLGGSSFDGANAIIQTSDSGYVAVGSTQSCNGDVTGCHNDSAYFFEMEGWVVKLSGNGSIQWDRCVFAGGNDLVEALMQTEDGGYIIGGYTSPYMGNCNAIFGKLSATGAIDWLGNYGGSGYDCFNSVALTNDGTGIAAGYTSSNDGDVFGNHGGDNFWVVKFGWHTNVPIVAGYGLTLAPNPANRYLSITAENEITSITITNIMGQVVYTYGGSGQNAAANSGKLAVDVHDWQAGLYFVQINGVVATKFVKE